MDPKSQKKQQLEELIDHYSNGNKAAFANLIGISPQGLNNWIRRGNFDPEVLYTHLDGISSVWLLSGEGSMLITPDKTKQRQEKETSTKDSTNMSYQSPNSFQFYSKGDDKMSRIALETLDKQVQEKDKQIDALNKHIDNLNKQIEALFDLINTRK